MQATQIGRLLRSLAPTNEEDLSLLQKLVVCARLMVQQRGHSDLQLGPRLVQAGDQDSQPGACGFRSAGFSAVYSRGREALPPWPRRGDGYLPVHLRQAAFDDAQRSVRSRAEADSRHVP